LIPISILAAIKLFTSSANGTLQLSSHWWLNRDLTQLPYCFVLYSAKSLMKISYFPKIIYIKVEDPILSGANVAPTREVPAANTFLLLDIRYENFETWDNL
jgi:hypothetical protein